MTQIVVPVAASGSPGQDSNAIFEHRGTRRGRRRTRPRR